MECDARLRGLRLVSESLVTAYENIHGPVRAAPSPDYLPQVYGMLFRVFEADAAGKALTRSQAGAYIRVSNAANTIKYLGLAREDGFVAFRPSTTDRRVVHVIPGPRLHAFVEAEIARHLKATLTLRRQLEELDLAEMPDPDQ